MPDGTDTLLVRYDKRWRLAAIALLIGIGCSANIEEMRPAESEVRQTQHATTHEAGLAAAPPAGDPVITDDTTNADQADMGMATEAPPTPPETAYTAQATVEDAQVEESMDDQSTASPELSPTALQTLLDHGWMDRVVSSLGVWVCVDTQTMYLLEGLEPVWHTAIATAKAGTGSTAGSYRTPLGWHRVAEKFGDDAPWGQVFRARAATQEIWRPGEDTEEDLVLTRILWLDGEEPGVNKGHNEEGVLVDSMRRYIYIHGTNGEAEIGTPSSRGCIRMRNDDVIRAYDMIPLGTPVLITETAP